MRKLVYLAVVVGALTGVSLVMADWVANEPGYSNCINKAHNEIDWANQNISNSQAEIERIKIRISQLNGDIPRTQGQQKNAELEVNRAKSELEKSRSNYSESQSNYEKALANYISSKKLREFIEATMPLAVSEFKSALLMSVELVNEQLQEATEEQKNATNETDKKRLQDKINFLKTGSEFRNYWNSAEEALQYFESLLANKVDPKSEVRFSSTLISFLLALQQLNNDFVKTLENARSSETKSKELADRLTETLSKMKQEIKSRELTVASAQNSLYQYRTLVEKLSQELTGLHGRYNQLNGDIQNYQILRSARETDINHGCWDRHKRFVRDPPDRGGRGSRKSFNEKVGVLQ